MTYSDFLTAYPPEKPRELVDEGMRAAFAKTLPAPLLELWDAVGFGKLREGMFELIDPTQYQAALEAFLGGDAGGRVPILLNAFGELITYKAIDAREAEIAILHPYGPRFDVVNRTLDDFFGYTLLESDLVPQVLNVPLFLELRSRLRRLGPGQVYGFDPQVLAEAAPGTKANAGWFEILDAVPHLRRLLTYAERDE